MTYPAEDLDALHDPGPAGAFERAEDVLERAREPIELEGGHEIRFGTASWTDPTMVAPRCLLPDRRRHGRGAAAVLRQPVPAGRSRRDVLRPALGPDGGAVAGAHAARLHVRHQGPRADDRPADRDEAAAEGHPDGAAAGARSQGAPLRPRPAGRAVGRDLAAVPGGPRAAARGRPARLDPAPVPALVLPVVGELGGDPRGPRAPRRPRQLASSSATAAGSTRRTSSGRNGS